VIPGIIGSGKNVDPVALKKIYDGFTTKDMTFEAFQKEIEGLTDPVRMAGDLMKIRSQIRPGGK
jgi:hypothetical protein